MPYLLGTRISFARTKKYFVDQTFVWACKQKGGNGCTSREARDLCEQQGGFLARFDSVPDVMHAFHVINHFGRSNYVSNLRFKIAGSNQVYYVMYLKC